MIAVVNSPLGKLALHGGSKMLTRLEFGASAPAEAPAEGTLLAEAASQLAAYFAGKLRRFDLPLEPEGTEFDLAVWRAMLEIPYGETRSYAELAAMAGRPAACRAAGTACGRNPLPILIPCHRVIRSDGGEGGYSAGMANKRLLLALEAKFTV